MSTDFSSFASRIIDVYPEQASEGPRLVVFGAVHGNEPSGVIALRQIFQQLRENEIPLAGQLIGVIGNTQALNQQVRYCDADLNRLFRDEYIEQLATGQAEYIAEAHEVQDLCALVEACEADRADPPFFVDGHTTSSASVPYISTNEGYDDSYRFAQPVPATTVMGVEKEIEGCLSEWLNQRGWHGFTLEAGQHQAAISVRNQAAIIWLALVNSGCLSEADGREYIRNAYETLRQQGSQQEKVYRVVSSYRIRRDEDFRMEPGFVNLQFVHKGEKLAVSNGEIIYAEEDAYLLMPLYQKQGSFGFFIAQEVETG